MITNGKFVRYEDFGAVGDGVTNDFFAMKRAHEYANENGLSVIGRTDAVYYVSETMTDGEASTITVKTDTDFCGATLVFDDRQLAADDGTNMHKKNIFTFLPDEPEYNLKEDEILKLGKVKSGQTKLNLKLPHPALLMIMNDNHKIYVRYGADANNGTQQTDLALVDCEGNVDESTPILFDYNEITRVRVIRTDVKPIVFKNLTVETRVSRISIRREDGTVVRPYFDRGLKISRSNVTVENLTHKIVGEYTPEEQAAGLCCPSYHGIINIEAAHNVTVRDSVIPARRYYRVSGTYAFNGYYSNQINIINVKQPNFYKADGVTPSLLGAEYWGWGAVNHTKNLVYDNVEVTRFDAHAGLVNGKILNSHVSVINIIGGGELLIENSLLEHDRIFCLRPDFGATWNGSVTVRNCKIKPVGRVYHLCSLLWTNFNFGHVCHFPSVTLDNISFVGGNVPATVCMEFKTDDERRGTLLTEKNIHLDTLESGEKNLNPYVPPKYLKFINNEANIDFCIEDLPFFENTEVEGFRKISVGESLSI